MPARSGWWCMDVPKVEKDVNNSLGLSHTGGYRSNSLTTFGDDHARLILVKRNRKWFSSQKQESKVHPVSATIHGAKAAEFREEKLGYQVNLKA